MCDSGLRSIFPLTYFDSNYLALRSLLVIASRCPRENTAMDLDVTRSEAMFTPGAQKTATWSGLDPKRGAFQKAALPKCMAVTRVIKEPLSWML